MTLMKQNAYWASLSPLETLSLEAYYTDRTYHRGGSREYRDPRGTRYLSARYLGTRYLRY